ncbi:Snf7-domain-containing protein [Dactylonectria estremocensis]|uniref:Snf7-domain-containing protein n=1 Tax=Dactylonectria estremocensis TaxID=1079267 RepID=A0A9P9FJR8_9HYPO|nr:Snf7-domain-containing protein [Dactylonectria estremocensis]
MGELADYLVNNDPSFRKSRLPALYSDFRPQRTLNPDGYAANLSAWRHALCQIAAHGLASHRGSSPNLFTIALDDSLLRSLESKQFGQPLALGTVVREAAADREFINLQDFNKSQQSIYTRTWTGVPWAVMGWTLRQLGVMDPSRGDDKLPVGQFVVIKNLEATAKELGDQMADKSSRFDRIFTKSQFQKAFTTTVVKGQRLSETDLEVLLKFLSRDKGSIEYDGQTVRIKGAGDQGGIAEEDSAIASLKELTESLKHQTDLLNTRIDELAQAAKDAVTRKNRVTALAALKSKKTAEASLATRYATLSQLEEVAAKIEQAADNIQLVKVMEASGSALKSLNAQVGDADRVDAVMDRVREQMNAADEVGAILAEATGAVVDEGEIDDELEAMMAQEREKDAEVLRQKQAAEKEVRKEQEAKEEAELQKTLDRLPEVPDELPVREKEATPTSQTGIAGLSIEAGEHSQTEKEAQLLPAV